MVRRTFTHRSVLTDGPREGWADAETSPRRIDWDVRQRQAAIPFRVVRGRPVNPCAKTAIRHGRNKLGRWGENLMADALVTAQWSGCRYLLMVKRADGYGWAVPGGSVEPGETGAQAAIRELAEETGLAVPAGHGQVQKPRYVPDPRASDEAWAVTIPLFIDLGQVRELPPVRGADDASQAQWIRAGSYQDLRLYLARVYGKRVFAAHDGMLRDFFGGSL